MEDEFQWDSANIEHIARHGVTPEEFEQVFNNGSHVVLDYTLIRGEERWSAIGHTDGGRFLIVVWTMRGNATRAVTAFEASRSMVNEYYGAQ